jgi:hypothetical protein
MDAGRVFWLPFIWVSCFGSRKIFIGQIPRLSIGFSDYWVVFLNQPMVEFFSGVSATAFTGFFLKNK